jgi:hypothetical protein
MIASSSFVLLLLLPIYQASCVQRARFHPCRNILARSICLKLIDPQSFEVFETGVTTQRDIYQGPDGSITWLSATELYAKGFDYEAFSFEDGAVMFTTVGALPNTAPVGPFNPPTNTASDIDIYLKCYLRAKVWV